MKKILIISLSNLKRDPRVYRQIINLKDEYDVTAIGMNSPEIEGVKFISTVKPELSWGDYILLKFGFYEKVYWKNQFIKLKELLVNENFDIVIANDLDALPLAVELAKGAKILYDAHEYFPNQQENSLFWRFFCKNYVDYLCRIYMSKADKMLTVSQSLVESYKDNYKADPILLTNAAEFYDLAPVETGDKIRIIYHGLASEGRGTDVMIELANYLDDRFTLDFLVVGRNEYIKKIIKKAENNPKIRFMPPVPREELVQYTNNYDIGLFLFKADTCFSYENCLPNKFFEYIQARLMLAIGPSKEMARITKEYDLGIVSEKFDPKELAEKINSLTKEQVMYYKNQSHKAAKELNSKNNIKMLKEIIKNL